jgi:hypothetical protein
MAFVWLAWLQAASPSTTTLWLRADFPQGSSCHVAALTSAIRAQRPEVVVALGARPGPSDLEAELTQGTTAISLSIRGRGKPLRREIPLTGEDCDESLQTAALMIDRYLDELNQNPEETPIEGLTTSTPTSHAFTVALGPSVVQAPAGLSPGLVLEVDLRLGLFSLALGGELNLPQHEAATEVTGTYDVSPAAIWLAAGVTPQLGPGRLVAQASLGLSLLWVSIGQTTPPTYEQQQGSAADPFVGLRLGYVLDLSARFSLGLRYEERWVPSPTTFSVFGYSGSVSVRAFSGDLALLVGYTLF